LLSIFFSICVLATTELLFPIHEQLVRIHDVFRVEGMEQRCVSRSKLPARRRTNRVITPTIPASHPSCPSYFVSNGGFG